MDKTMEKNMKKWIEFGLGVAAITGEALNEAMTKLEKEGKISRKDGKRMVDAMISKYKSKQSKYESDARAQMASFMKTLPFATKKDIADLNRKISSMSKSKGKSKSKKKSRK
jgi:polyhydroxyalkanoate synthesis regulator phasin